MTGRTAVLALVASLSALTAVVVLAQAPAAKPGVVAITVEKGLESNLVAHKGKKVELVLGSGKSLVGTVQGVGSGSVHLSALEGKEFYDALVKLEEVSAVVVRAK